MSVNNPPFNEDVFKNDVFSSISFEERQKEIARKKQLFEESESVQFAKNKQQMKERLQEVHNIPTTNDTTESFIEEINEEEEIKEEKVENELKNKEKDEYSSKPERIEEEEEEEELLTIEEINELVKEATEYKQKGNEFYGNGLWEAAIGEYTKAIDKCPRKEKIRSIFYGNRAACWQNLSSYENVVKDCDKALKLDNNYVKVIQRRANANEKLDKLSEALEDYKKLLELNPNNKIAQKAVQYLPQQITVKQEREKEEMMGKLKEVGNSLLGLVGLSLDNFQFNQDPNSGGYSVNFQNS